MERLGSDGDWFLFDPVDVPKLHTVHGDEFTRTYNDYVRTVKFSTCVRARDLWRQICDAQVESGTPFIMYQDNINSASEISSANIVSLSHSCHMSTERNAQQQLGLITSSNLCTEIVQYASVAEPAVCTLASISLPRFVRSDKTFDFMGLHALVKLVIQNTDRLIDVAKYPSGSAAASAKRSRAIGLGVQGLADTFMALGLPYSSGGARQLNVEIFEAIYHAALETSCELAKIYGPYPAWSGSPAASGLLYFDMWPVAPRTHFDFDGLRTQIRQFGLRNALLTAQMPTTSTAYLLGNSPGVEPYTRCVVCSLICMFVLISYYTAT